MPRHVDLSHTIEDGLVTYPGLPAPHIDEHLTRAASRERYAPGTEFSSGRIVMVANTGTYLDSPFHRFADGTDLAGLDLDRLVDLEGLVIRVVDRTESGIGPEQLVGREVRGRAVLIHTGWDRQWATDVYGHGHPFRAAAGATWLVEHGAALVGIESLNIDDTDDLARPAHTGLLAAGIPIVEHLTGPSTSCRWMASSSLPHHPACAEWRRGRCVPTRPSIRAGRPTPERRAST